MLSTMLHSLTWFLGAFGATLTTLALLRYRLNHYEKHIDLKNTLQEISQEVALGYFQHCYNKLSELSGQEPYKSQIEVLKAQCLQGLGRKDELLEFLNRTLEHHPKNHTARRMLARQLVEAGDHPRALEQFEILEGHLQDEDLLAHATALYQTNRWSDCQQIIEHTCRQPNGQILGLLGDALFQQQEWGLALDYYQKAENLGWRPLGQISHKAISCLKLMRYPEAEIHFREWLRASPSDLESVTGLACSLERQNKVEEAFTLLNQYEEDLIEDPLAQATLGRCHFRRKQYARATHHLLSAYELEHIDATTLALAAISLEKQTRWSHAEKLYETLTKDYPEHVAGYAGLSYLFAIGQAREIGPQRGLDLALRVVELQPCMASWEILSGAYARCGMFEKAHQIQENLMRYAKEEIALLRRQDSMRKLRQHKPLGSQLILRLDVA